MNKKKILAVILLIIGIAFIGVGIFRFIWPEYTEEQSADSNTSNENPDIQDNDEEIGPLEDGILLEEFKATKYSDQYDDNLLQITIKILNNSLKDIKNEMLKIIIYDNSVKKDEFQYKITELNKYEDTTINTIFVFPYKKSYEYEVIFDGKKTKLELDKPKIYKIN